MFDEASFAVQGAVDAGAEYADARVVFSKSETNNVQNQNLSQFDRSEHAGVGVRALIGSSWGFVSTSDLDAGSIRAAGEASAAIAAASGLVPGPQIEFVDVLVPDTTWETPFDEDLLAVSLSEKVDLLIDVTATASRRFTGGTQG